MEEADNGCLMTTVGVSEWVNVSSGASSTVLSRTKYRAP